MNDVLLVLSTSRTPDEAMDFAVAEAKKRGGRLYSLYVVELALAKEVFDRFSDIGFIGDKPSTELSEAVMKEYKQRGYEEMGKVQIKAMEAAVGFEPIMEQGEGYVAKVLEQIGAHEIELVVATKRKSSFLKRYLHRSEAEELKEKARCEVRLFDEE